MPANAVCEPSVVRLSPLRARQRYQTLALEWILHPRCGGFEFDVWSPKSCSDVEAAVIRCDVRVWEAGRVEESISRRATTLAPSVL